MIRKLFKKSKDASVLVGVKNLVVLLLWMPLVMVLWGAGLGIGFYVYRFGRYAEIPDISSIGQNIDTTGTLLIIGLILGATGLLYLVLSNATLGSKNVDKGIDQGEEIANEVDERT